MGHYLRVDMRMNVLKSIISPFQIQLENIAKKCEKDNFNYWDSVYADDTEHIVGTVFIVLQNYINSSISDLFPDLEKLHTKYTFDKKIENSKVTRIELIIALANYYKHRDLPTELHIHTSKTLNNLKLEFKEIFDIENNKYYHKIGSSSPVFNGFGVLSEFWNFNELIDIVGEWRENLWINEEKNEANQSL